MARDFSDADADARKLIGTADSMLGFSLSTMCFEGPEGELRQTKNTQPAIFLHSVVAARALGGRVPSMVAGHSLGEYSALVVAGAIDFPDALRLVRLRGELMQQAGEERKGTMAAIVGLTPAQVDELCVQASASGVVQPANFNAPGQIVISGSVEGVHVAMERAKGMGAKLVRELEVSGAFHSPLMESARDGLKRALDAAPIRDAHVPVYANVTGEPAVRATEIRNLLYRQLTSPVRWEETVRNMVRDGATELVEVGPGKILQGLAKRIVPGTAVSGVDSYTDVQRLEA
jgi:[acyl-carrier-protein] S-malonyltransferase